MCWVLEGKIRLLFFYLRSELVMAAYGMVGGEKRVAGRRNGKGIAILLFNLRSELVMAAHGMAGGEKGVDGRRNGKGIDILIFNL